MRCSPVRLSRISKNNTYLRRLLRLITSPIHLIEDHRLQGLDADFLFSPVGLPLIKPSAARPPRWNYCRVVHVRTEP